MYCPKCNVRLTGKGFSIVEIIILVVVIIFGVALIMLSLRHIRKIYHRMDCGTNLALIGQAMLIYTNDYKDQLPRAGGRDTAWGLSIWWDAIDRFEAYNLSQDGSGGDTTISSSFYLLVKYAEVTPKSFICKGDTGTTEFKLSDYPNRNPSIKENIDAWDFGPIPAKHCSYTYHMPYGQYALTTTSEPGMAVAADRNPWIESPDADFKDYRIFKPDIPPWNGTVEQAKFGNAITHQGDGQNVLFMDSHVDFEKRPWCGIEDDNIYTNLPQGLGYPQLDEPALAFFSQPGHRKDSLLVHDPPVAPMRPPKRRPRR